MDTKSENGPGHPARAAVWITLVLCWCLHVAVSPKSPEGVSMVLAWLTITVQLHEANIHARISTQMKCGLWACGHFGKWGSLYKWSDKICLVPLSAHDKQMCFLSSSLGSSRWFRIDRLGNRLGSAFACCIDGFWLYSSAPRAGCFETMAFSFGIWYQKYGMVKAEIFYPSEG